ncbi:transferrin-binding protein-like solute binding protein [Hoeflea sp.]|uniref:transferrin-binding protein-like solute binding protein n=1 Tax=Hoeflea sp. TaxID=1940281 RepID=UPI003B02E222
MMKQSPQETAGGRTRTHGNARRALLCTAALLSLGLAACNTTGGTTTTTTTRTPAAPTTELGKARAAAKAAMDAAKTQSDAAAVEAAKAEAAQMNIAMLQTGDPMAKTHAEAARAAARAAMTAYNTAKAESAKAAAATTDTAAVEARIAAQAAQRTAQAQAKIAMDKAAAAVKAAGMEVKVTYDDDGQATYRVGDVTIVAGAEKMVKTVNDGPKRTTGKLGDEASDDYTYRPGEPKGDKEMAQPQVARRKVYIGTITDSEDDNMRLRLFDKYVTRKNNRMVKVYKSGGPSTQITPTSTGEATYGEHTADGKKYAIKRAEGEFYAVTGVGTPTKENLETFTIESGTTGSKHIYYYEINGVKTYLELESSIVNSNGTTTFTFNKPAVVENVRFPAVKAFEHMNFGIWSKLNEQKKGSDKHHPPEPGTGFVSKLPGGTVTPTGDMPNFGTATYEGIYTADIRAADPSGAGDVTNWYGPAKTTANFGKNTISSDLNWFVKLEGTIDGNTFEGTTAKLDSRNPTWSKLDPTGTFNGKFSGNFFGPKAEEVGGVFDFTSEGRKAGEFSGAFGGARLPAD